MHFLGHYYWHLHRYNCSQSVSYEENSYWNAADQCLYFASYWICNGLLTCRRKLWLLLEGKELNYDVLIKAIVIYLAKRRLKDKFSSKLFILVEKVLKIILINSKIQQWDSTHNLYKVHNKFWINFELPFVLWTWLLTVLIFTVSFITPSYM